MNELTEFQRIYTSILRALRKRMSSAQTPTEAASCFSDSQVTAALLPLLNRLNFLQGVFASFWTGESISYDSERFIQHLPWRNVRYIHPNEVEYYDETNEVREVVQKIFGNDHAEQGRILDAHRNCISCWEEERGIIFAEDGEISLWVFEWKICSGERDLMTWIRQGLLDTKGKPTARLRRMLAWWVKVIGNQDEYSMYFTARDPRLGLVRSLKCPELVAEWKTACAAHKCDGEMLLSNIADWITECPHDSVLLEQSARYSLAGHAILRENESISRSFISVRLLPTYDDLETNFHGYFLATFLDVDSLDYPLSRDQLADEILLIFPLLGYQGVSLLANTLQALRAQVENTWSRILAHDYRNSNDVMLSGLRHCRQVGQKLKDAPSDMDALSIWHNELSPYLEFLITHGEVGSQICNLLLDILKNKIDSNFLYQTSKEIGISIHDIFLQQIHMVLAETIAAECGCVQSFLSEKLHRSPEDILAELRDKCLRWRAYWNETTNKVIWLDTIVIQCNGASFRVGKDGERVLRHIFSELARNSLVKGFEGLYNRWIYNKEIIPPNQITVYLHIEVLENPNVVKLIWSNTAYVAEVSQEGLAGGLALLSFLLERLGGRISQNTFPYRWETQVLLPSGTFS